MAMDLTNCQLCPRRCGVNRAQGELGRCKAGPVARLARAALHFWEEPCISGSKGSGTVFFSHCSLGCIFCQNSPVSSGQIGAEASPAQLAAIFLNLQDEGAHNLNLVTATHYLPQIMEALALARSQGFSLPVVYNSSGYECTETIDQLQGIVDVFLPDLKYYSPVTARQYAAAPDYFATATQAIRRMAEIVGPCQFNADGILTKGLLLRHLVLPGHTEESRKILRWIKDELPEWVMVSLMGQYLPVAGAVGHPRLGRRLTRREYQSVVDYLLALGLENGYCQELTAASSAYIPAFDLTGVPQL